MAATFPNTPRARLLLLLGAALSAECTSVREELFIPVLPSGGSGGQVPPRVTAGEGGSPEQVRPPEAGSAVVRNDAGASALNPAISFAWPGTIPGAGACRAAEFTGNFSCVVKTPLVTETLEGSITLRLSGSTENKLLTIDNGRGQLLTFDQDKNRVLTAPVTGVLDCNKQLLTAELQPTRTEVMPIERGVTWLNLSPQPTTTGKLEGSFDSALQTITGDIHLVFDMAPTCDGEFTLRAGP